MISWQWIIPIVGATALTARVVYLKYTTEILLSKAKDMSALKVGDGFYYIVPEKDYMRLLGRSRSITNR